MFGEAPGRRFEIHLKNQAPTEAFQDSFLGRGDDASDASNGELPGLAAGWRADLVGHLIEELLEGRRSIQITNPRSENPLEFKRVDP